LWKKKKTGSGRVKTVSAKIRAWCFEGKNHAPNARNRIGNTGKKKKKDHNLPKNEKVRGWKKQEKRWRCYSPIKSVQTTKAGGKEHRKRGGWWVTNLSKEKTLMGERETGKSSSGLHGREVPRMTTSSCVSGTLA